MGVRSGRIASYALFGVVALLALASRTGSVWLQAAACGLAGLFAASAVSAWWAARCEVELDHPAELAVGSAFDVEVVARNPSSRRSAPMVVRYGVADPRVLVPDVSFYLDPIPPGGQVVVRASAIPLARGEAREARWTVERIGAFGLISVRHTRTAAKRVLVAPAPAPPIDLLATGGAADGVGRPRPGLDVRGVREWRPGDGVRHVHWRSTARTGRLAVLERADTAREALGVLIVGTAGQPVFERLLSVAASTVGVAVGAGIECYAWLEQPGGGCVGKLRPDTFLLPFARAERAGPPSEQGFFHLCRHVGAGGTLLLVAAGDTPPGWREQLARACATSGLEVVDLGWLA